MLSYLSKNFQRATTVKLTKVTFNQAQMNIYIETARYKSYFIIIIILLIRLLNNRVPSTQQAVSFKFLLPSSLTFVFIFKLSVKLATKTLKKKDRYCKLQQLSHKHVP